MYEIRNAPFFILSLIIEIKPVEFKKHILFLEGRGGGRVTFSSYSYFSILVRSLSV